MQLNVLICRRDHIEQKKKSYGALRMAITQNPKPGSNPKGVEGKLTGYPK